ncbi:CGNR zinc finger domain-containing protein [Rhodococcus sp. H29-C3]|uniref:CGNR zinc finger domain-containing protein n=1 Tax=Rhodococcus sp. H29-C3 TaxID=3046307 RepID=UPI0024BA3219|nr:CGNR zinc finger domain-containing protein [Rhodococcus sp. H29-C3]MDJ0363146.1 CGNR zinc finger domain-containing protein [Rhodococcus sp. H29-C3]
MATLLANTAAGQRAADRLTTVNDAKAFFATIGLDSVTVQVTDDDLSHLRHFRDRVRTILAASTVESAVADLNDLLREAEPLVKLDRSDLDGQWHWHLAVTSDADVIRRLQLVVVPSLLAMARTFGISRFRSCTTDSCTGMFVDASRGGRRRFCDPARCGNRAHVAAHRARRNPTS